MPKKPPPEPILRKACALRETMWREVAAYQQRAQIVTESEALRRLIRAGLDASDRERKA